MRTAVYKHNNVGRDVLHEILKALGAKAIAGRSEQFVPIDTEAVRAGDVAQAKQSNQDHAFYAIVTTDGDADSHILTHLPANKKDAADYLLRLAAWRHA